MVCLESSSVITARRSLSASTATSTFGGVFSGGSVSCVSSSGSSIVSLGVTCSRGEGVSLSSILVIEAVEVLGCGAVKVEPPVADEVVLVEEGSVGAEEAVLGETAGSVSCADVEGLAFGLWVSVVA